ncbi:MAG: PAS domain-containing sensor histidine kinase [Burkholderiales bacterium 70-64]|nr:MAG: PAS domain-containing sensor histidine kinase [Burkholderiales bacterium 70-64]
MLASAVAVLDAGGGIVFLNQAAEQLLGVSLRFVTGQPFARLFVHGEALEQLCAEARSGAFEEKRTDLVLERPGREAQQFAVTAVVLQDGPGTLLLELHERDQRWRADREARLLESAQANRELVRNLAHEIKNPLGGLRGAAQLLESELKAPALREYTQVIIKEADRLQGLVDRLLAPHRHPRIVGDVNIHEVCERVRSVVLAEFPQGLVIARDYDASLPEFRGDREQLIQVLLNLVRNAAQAMQGRGEILLRTRIARQVTIAGTRWKLALDLHVIDNGPGVPEEIGDRIFFPLVTGRDGGSGLGLTLAQTFVQQHGGLIECESRPGRTDFRILLPLP